MHLLYHKFVFVWCMEVEDKYLIFAKKFINFWFNFLRFL